LISGLFSRAAIYRQLLKPGSFIRTAIYLQDLISGLFSRTAICHPGLTLSGTIIVANFLTPNHYRNEKNHHSPVAGSDSIL